MSVAVVQRLQAVDVEHQQREWSPSRTRRPHHAPAAAFRTNAGCANRSGRRSGRSAADGPRRRRILRSSRRPPGTARSGSGPTLRTETSAGAGWPRDTARSRTAPASNAASHPEHDGGEDDRQVVEVLHRSGAGGTVQREHRTARRAITSTAADARDSLAGSASRSPLAVVSRMLEPTGAASRRVHHSGLSTDSLGAPNLLARLQLPFVGHLDPPVTKRRGVGQRVRGARPPVPSLVIDNGADRAEVDDDRGACRNRLLASRSSASSSRGRGSDSARTASSTHLRPCPLVPSQVGEDPVGGTEHGVKLVDVGRGHELQRWPG